MKKEIWIEALRFPMAFLVVWIHCFVPHIEWDAVKFSDGLSGDELYCLLGKLFSITICSAAVPLFMFISGYLLFKNVQNTYLWGGKLRKRIRTLLLPYILWISIYIIYANMGLPLVSIADIIKMYWCSESLSKVSMFGNNLYHYYPFLVPMWFIRNLIVFVVISPCLFWLLKSTDNNKIGKKAIFFLVIVCLLDITRVYPMPLYLSSWKSLLFFSFGVLVQINRIVLQPLLAKLSHKLHFLIIGILLLAMLFGGNSTKTGNLFLNIFTILECALLIKIAINSKLSLKVANAHCFGMKLSEMTFFIFAFHIFVLHYVSNYLSRFLQCIGLSHGIAILVYMLSPIFCVMFCICVYCTLKKTMPSVLHILTGR